MKTINGVEYFEDVDFYMCKNVEAGTDSYGQMIPCCKLSGLPCDEVLRNGDEGCKYEYEEPHDNPPFPWD